jgi:predicted AlkP superfamily pyrophosphatase or phosphodiesterase
LNREVAKNAKKASGTWLGPSAASMSSTIWLRTSNRRSDQAKPRSLLRVLRVFAVQKTRGFDRTTRGTKRQLAVTLPALRDGLLVGTETMPARLVAILVSVAAGCAGAGVEDGTAGAGSVGGLGAAPAVRRAIVVSIDGLMPESYVAPDRRGLAVPTLRGMVAGGAWARSARPVMPTVTYPAHTTIATGVEPGGHGIVGNRTFDPMETNQAGWRWYAEDIRVPALWDAVEGAGRVAALVTWPVTVGARARYLVPEYWRAGTSEDQKLLRALSTPGLLERVEARFPDLWQKLTPPDMADEAAIDIAVHLLDTSSPDLLMVHIWMVDEMQHRSGPWSEPARVAIENADRQVARLVAACRRSGTWSETALFVVSDHGFATAHTEVRLAALMRERGLIQVGDDGKPTAWRASVQSNGGTAYIHLAEPNDGETLRAVREALAPLAAGPDAALRRIFEPEAIRAMGGDPVAALAVEAADGFVLADGVGGPWRKPVGSVGQHGYAPDRESMRASFLAYGPGVRPVELGEVRLVDVAPTVARWLGVPLERATGRALDIEGVR